MQCNPIKIGDATGIVCTRGRRSKCATPGCGQPAVALCDFPVTRKGQPTTCSAKICERCRVRKGENVDHCPPHARLDAAPREPQRGDKRIHIALGVELWVYGVGEDAVDGTRYVTIGRTPPGGGRCGVLQTVPLDKWREKTKAPPMSAGPCRGCGKTIEWRKSGEGKNVPLDPEPHPDGNIMIDDEGRALYAARGSRPAMFLNHFATCPKAEQFRRKPKGAR